MSHHFLKFTDVSYTYPSGFKALKDVSFCITHGQKVALLGLNGAGKSTLLMLTNGLFMPSKGEVNVGDVPLSKKTLPIIRKSVGMVFQNPDDQLFMPTVREDVAFGPKNMGLPPEEVRRRVERALIDVGAYELIDRPSSQLSGGQKRSVAIASVLAMEPDILVMDEPTSNLDLKARSQVIHQINHFSHTCLIATHDLDMASEVCSHAMMMARGRILAFGEISEILGNRNLMQQTFYGED